MLATRDGLRLGCDEALDLPDIARLMAAGFDNDGGGSRLRAGRDVCELVDSVGDEAALAIEGGADVLLLRMEIVPCVGEELMSGSWSRELALDASDRAENVEPPRGRWLKNAELFGDGISGVTVPL